MKQKLKINFKQLKRRYQNEKLTLILVLVLSTLSVFAQTEKNYIFSIAGFDAIKNMIPYSRSRIKIDLIPSEPKDVEALVSVERTSAFKEWMDK